MPVRVSGGAVDSIFGCCARSVLLVLHAFALPCACAWCVLAGPSQLMVGEIVEGGDIVEGGRNRNWNCTCSLSRTRMQALEQMRA